MPKPLPFMRAFDDSRNIGHHKAAMIRQLHDAEIRLQRRKRIIGNLRPRRRNARNQRRFARIRITHQPDIRQQLQFQLQLFEFARLAVFVFGRRLVRGVVKRALPAAAAPALRREPALPVFGEIEQRRRRFRHR